MLASSGIDIPFNSGYSLRNNSSFSNSVYLLYASYYLLCSKGIQSSYDVINDVVYILYTVNVVVIKTTLFIRSQYD